MTSEEIKNTKFETIGFGFWLKEIAYQLARLYELSEPKYPLNSNYPHLKPEDYPNFELGNDYTKG